MSRKRWPRAGPALTLRMNRLGTGAGAAGRAAAPVRGTPPAGVGELRRPAPDGLAAGAAGREAGGPGGDTTGAEPVGLRAGEGGLPQVFPQASQRCAPAAFSTSQDGQTTPS
ncbi:MAG TPA: hypothetical protein VMT11_10175 [Myxococcaceae bacterium]|nr:hypothetical protein [Myxococcaceae bacterium]